MKLSIVRGDNWVSITSPELEIGGAGVDLVSAFTAFGRSMQSYEESLRQCSKPCDYKKRWKEANRDHYLRKNREYVAAYRQRKSKKFNYEKEEK